MDELLFVVGRFLEKQGEKWRIGEGAELVDAYQAALEEWGESLHAEKEEH